MDLLRLINISMKNDIVFKSFEVDENEKRWINGLARGDREAFKKIYYHFYPRLLAAVVRIIKSREDAEEIVQETFLKIWEGREKINTSLSFAAYLFTIVRNRSLDFLKKAANTATLKEKLWLELEAGRNSTEEQFFFNEFYQLTQRAITQLPEQRRKIYQLSREEGLSHDEISSKLGISKNTVKNHMVEALKDIRQYLFANTGSHHPALILFLLTLL